MSNTEEFVNLLNREIEQFVDEGYDKLDQKEHEMRELGLNNYGDSSYYIQNPDEYEKDNKICELENEVERLNLELSLTEKALELACEELWDTDGFSLCMHCVEGDEVCHINCGGKTNEEIISNYFKTQAKEIMKSE